MRLGVWGGSQLSPTVVHCDMQARFMLTRENQEISRGWGQGMAEQS